MINLIFKVQSQAYTQASHKLLSSFLSIPCMNIRQKNYWKNEQQKVNSGWIKDDLLFFFISFYTF